MKAKNLGMVQTRALLPRHLFFLVFGLGLGFYEGFFGSGMAIEGGAPFIRPIFLTMVFLTIIRLI